MTSSLKSSESCQVVVFAKHQFYLDSAIEAFKGSGIKLVVKSSISDFNEIEISANKKTYLFFPHISEKIDNSLLDHFTCIGFHTGDLPKDRGGSPIQNKILKGEYLTKLSAFLLTNELDAGPIYLQTDLDLSRGNIESILRNISKLAARMMLEIVTRSISPIPQMGEPTIVKRLSRSDSQISSLNLNPTQMYDRIRMVDGLDYPKARMTIDNFDLVFSNANLDNGNLTASCTFLPKEL